jgi:DNA-directed RNA polymerase subunit E'/Rpb7
MMDTVIIETQMRLTSKDLKQTKIRNILQEKLNEMYLQKFTKQYGYILEIIGFTFNKDTILSRINQDIFIKCKVELLTIIPKIGEIYYGIVKIVYPQGIFIKLLNIFDTLIPYEYIAKLGYSFHNGEFVNGADKITKEKYLNVKIIDMKYDNKTFNCIAELCDINEIVVHEPVAEDEELEE